MGLAVSWSRSWDWRGGPWVHLVQSHGVLGHMMAYVTLLSVQSYATIRWAEWVI